MMATSERRLTAAGGHTGAGEHKKRMLAMTQGQYPFTALGEGKYPFKGGTTVAQGMAAALTETELKKIIKYE